MSGAFEQLIQHLDQHEVGYRRRGENEAIDTQFQARTGSYRVVAWVDAEDSLFQVYGFAPARVPEGCFPAVAETIARANFRLKVGKFELDFAEGVVLFHVAHILQDDGLPDDLIRRVIVTVLSMLDRYMPAILSVVYGNEAPADAVRCVEVA